MVVTGSRLSAVKYKLAFDRYVKVRGYEGIKSLVAFSGEVEDPDDPGRSYTEVAMNEGLAESELPETFERDDYRVLLVAEKYQTGFDQPLLQTMYVVKKLAGVQAVQTLSRLNRMAPGKTRTFILDFVNEEKDIFDAFKFFDEIARENAKDYLGTIDNERLCINAFLTHDCCLGILFAHLRALNDPSVQAIITLTKVALCVG